MPKTLTVQPSANIPRLGASISTITVTVHPTVTVSASTYSTPQQTRTASASPSSDSTGDLAPPARPTSLSTAATAPGTTQAPTGGSICPMGFYACSAVYQGGCCRTGRDCDTTSCPTTPSTTVVSGDVTIVVPVRTMTAGTGHCAQGWFSCADTVGGGCCPTGFACGSSCAATAGSSTVAKSVPGRGGSGKMREGGILGVGVAVVAVAVINHVL